MNVHQRYSAVQNDMSKVGVEKAGKNQQQGYMYRGIDQVMNALAPILARHEVMILPSVISHSYEKGTTRNGGVSYHHTVDVEYLIAGPEGDTMGPFRSSGECIDTSDKGLNKACTAAFKYWVLTALCVPLEGHDDADSNTPEVSGATLGDDERLEITTLCGKSNTPVDGFVTWLGYNTLSEVPLHEFDRATKALHMKLEKQAKEYAQGETPQ